MKKTVIGVLTFLLLPLGAAVSSIIVAFLLIGITPFFPFIILGCTFRICSYIVEKINFWLFSNSVSFKPSLLVTFLLTPFLVLPTALFSVTLLAAFAVILLPGLAFFAPFEVAILVTNKIETLCRGTIIDNSSELEVDYDSGDYVDSDEESFGEHPLASSSAPTPFFSSANLHGKPNWSEQELKSESSKP